MTWQRLIPLLVLLIFAVLVLVLVLWSRRRTAENQLKDRNAAEANWNNVCEFDNPETGAKCQRSEFHLENHYHDVGGRLVQWP